MVPGETLLNKGKLFSQVILNSGVWGGAVCFVLFFWCLKFKCKTYMSRNVHLISKLALSPTLYPGLTISRGDTSLSKWQHMEKPPACEIALFHHRLNRACFLNSGRGLSQWVDTRHEQRVSARHQLYPTQIRRQLEATLGQGGIFLLPQVKPQPLLWGLLGQIWVASTYYCNVRVTRVKADLEVIYSSSLLLLWVNGKQLQLKDVW